VDEADYDRVEQGDTLVLEGLRDLVEDGDEIEITVEGKDPIRARHSLSPRQREYVLTGGTTNWMRDRI
jgi:aconitate hydratase